MAAYEIRVCENSTCRLRYPLTEGHSFGERCPICMGPTVPVLKNSLSPENLPKPEKSPHTMYALLDNIRSAWNVGAIFRTADGLGIQKLFLCGITPSPGNASLRKTALGADETIQWEHNRNALDLAEKLISEGYVLWALEQDSRSVSVYSTFLMPSTPIVLIVGNEITGVDPHLLNLCERIVHIPMLGNKRSLNVEVAFGIAVSIIRGNFTSR